MNYDSLSISVSKLSEDITTVSTCLTSYKGALETFKTSVTSVQSAWTGDESGVMAAFKQKYDAAATTLDELETLLGTLKDVMSTKCSEFQTAEKEAKGLFDY